MPSYLNNNDIHMLIILKNPSLHTTNTDRLSLGTEYVYVLVR